MTVEGFIKITPGSYVDLAINEYEGDKNIRRVVLEKNKWSAADIPEDLLKKEIVAIIPYFNIISLEVNAEPETWLHNKVKECWLVKTSYSWGDEESDEEFLTFEEAWEAAKRMAISEAETSSIEHDCEIGLSFNKKETEGVITLHYSYDNEYCYYYVVKR